MVCTKVRRVSVVILVVFLLCTNLTACSIPRARPQEGIWYCEELMIEINFNKAKTGQRCARIVNKDGTFQDILCAFDFGSVVELISEDEETTYLIGNFEHYEDNLFLVTTIDKTHTYVFVRIDEQG